VRRDTDSRNGKEKQFAAPEKTRSRAVALDTIYIAEHVMLLWCSYSKLTEEEIKLDRYAKFRALGQFEEHLVPGGQWRETRASRAKVSLLLHASVLSELPALLTLHAHCAPWQMDNLDFNADTFMPSKVVPKMCFIPWLVHSCWF